MPHPIHRHFYAEDLVRLRRARERRRQIASQRSGKVDPNPHQIDAVMFALRRIPHGGCILADEVGLGKTIEAGLVITQLLAEGAARVLVIVPRPLLGQWQTELFDLFGIDAVEASDACVDAAAAGVFLAGREYVGGESWCRRFGAAGPFDLCLIDEAHEVFAGIYRRFDKDGVYQEESRYARTAHRVRRIIGTSPVLLLTATPIQNSLNELWGLVQYVDPTGTLLGDKPVFDDVFCNEDGRSVRTAQAEELKRRLATVVQRTLRRQAQEFLDKPFVGRRAQLFEYRMSLPERALYVDVTEYLMSPRLHAFQGSARQLLLLGFHRRMASSTAALAASLERVAARLRRILAGENDAAAESFAEDLEEIADRVEGEDGADGGDGNSGAEGNSGAQITRAPPPAALPEMARPTGAGSSAHVGEVRDELARVEDFIRRAHALAVDSKAASLVKAVRLVMDRPQDRRKVVVFTESLTTQDYLHNLLIEQAGLRDEDITLFRGANDSPRAMAALRAWREDGMQRDRLPSPAVAVRLALVHEFRTRSIVMISSEAGAKGLNLQFCDTIVNYDMPWNPQRIEQRIGRCHRYGQQRDVTVVNFLAKDNEAQRLTFDILSTKLELFGDVLDMSDDVLHTRRSNDSEALVSALGSDFESRLQRIWERARSMREVEDELRQLSETMEGRRQELERVRAHTVGLIESGLDESVREVFRRIQGDIPDALAELDAELERVLVAYLDASGAPWSVDEQGGQRLLHVGASSQLPTGFREGQSIALGGPQTAAGPDRLHLGHPLIKAAVAEARESGSRAFRVRFTLRGDASAALQNRRGSRGRLALTRIAHRGFEHEDRLCVTAVFEDADVLRPAEAAHELIRQPCMDIEPFEVPLGVTPEQLDEVVDEERFFDQGEVAANDQAGFEAAMDQLDQYLADRTLVLRRAREQHLRRLADGERRRDAALGADDRARAEARVREAERAMERVDEEIEALAERNDRRYNQCKAQAHGRRYAVPSAERLLTAEFVIA